MISLWFAKTSQRQNAVLGLGRSSGPIKIPIENILDKLGAADRPQAVTIAIQRGIIRLG
jgi:DNA-binding NarL/FixJ family response regulator